MAMSLEKIDIAARIDPPATAQVRERLTQYMAELGLGSREIGEQIGFSGSALRSFIRGDYRKKGSRTNAFFVERLSAAIWNLMERNSARPVPRNPARLFPTENFRRIQSYFKAATERGEVCLLYGPPGTQKSFVLEYLVEERESKGLSDAIYVYMTFDTRPLALLRRIGIGAGVITSSNSIDSMLARLCARFSSAHRPPAIIVDEAQHLGVEALEVLRELHDRAGCGLLLAGSHDLYEKFLRGRRELEQWLSRVDHKDPLPGLKVHEVQEIAARELGNGQPAKLSDKQVEVLVKACLVDDFFGHGADGKQGPVKYLSVRRLVKVLAQFRARKARA